MLRFCDVHSMCWHIFNSGGNLETRISGYVEMRNVGNYLWCESMEGLKCETVAILMRICSTTARQFLNWPPVKQLFKQLWAEYLSSLLLTFFNPYFNVRQVLTGGFMSTATITSKGQITIPAVVRAALGVEVGDRIEFVQVEPGRFELVASTQPVSALKGLVRKPTSPVTIDVISRILSAQTHFFAPHSHHNLATLL